DQTVVRDIAYDALGRIRIERLAVGAYPPIEQQSTWRIATGSVWQRETKRILPGWTATITLTHDIVGRLARITPPSIAGISRSIDLLWLGAAYTGRDHGQPGRAEPLRERIDLDAFGLPQGWRTSVDANPSNPAAIHDAHAVRD